MQGTITVLNPTETSNGGGGGARRRRLLDHVNENLTEIANSTVSWEFGYDVQQFTHTNLEPNHMWRYKIRVKNRLFASEWVHFTENGLSF